VVVFAIGSADAFADSPNRLFASVLQKRPRQRLEVVDGLRFDPLPELPLTDLVGFSPVFVLALLVLRLASAHQNRLGDSQRETGDGSPSEGLPIERKVPDLRRDGRREIWIETQEDSGSPGPVNSVIEETLPQLESGPEMIRIKMDARMMTEKLAKIAVTMKSGASQDGMIVVLLAVVLVQTFSSPTRWPT